MLRQDPDVILVGEMRDLETHVHGDHRRRDRPPGADARCTPMTRRRPSTASSTSFPPHQQSQIRLQLANSLQAIFCQTLCRRSAGGRVLAYELLIANNAVRNLIREGKIHQIPSAIETGAQFGMRTMYMSLIDLVRKNVVIQGRSARPCDRPAGV